MPPMHLAVDDHRVDRAPDIVDRAVAHDVEHPGLGVDLDLADMAAVRKRGELDGLVALTAQRTAQLVG